MSHQISFLQAIREAMQEEMRRDNRIIVLGEDIRAPLWAEYGFIDEFGPERVLETPISEAGFVGAAVGAAMTGLRPIVDMTIASLMFCAMDQFASQAAKARYMFGRADVGAHGRPGRDDVRRGQCLATFGSSVPHVHGDPGSQDHRPGDSG